MSITVKESNLETANKIHKLIPEFNEPDYIEKNLNRLDKQNNPLVTVAYSDSVPVGYAISYDRDRDNSFYLWMAGVLPEYRQLGAMKSLMNYLYEWAKKKSYVKIKVKTRNDKKAMIINLVKEGFFFTRIETMPNPDDTELHLEKLL